MPSFLSFKARALFSLVKASTCTSKQRMRAPSMDPIGQIRSNDCAIFRYLPYVMYFNIYTWRIDRGDLVQTPTSYSAI